MFYGDIKKCDVANGVGVRVSLFVSGCRHHCPGCFNQETWDFSYGEKFTAVTEEEILNALAPDYIRGLSLLGGEPFEPENQVVLAPFLAKVKAKYPTKDIWCYSGYLYDTEILPGKWPDKNLTGEMLSYIDVLVDGEFILAKKQLNLRFRGSTNQRIIDVKKSLATGKVLQKYISTK
jgi:anaerobic ribonucleoside-triphosphate reductase activating protein